MKEVTSQGMKTFQISLIGVLRINDLHNAYLKFDAEHEFVFTTDTLLANVIIVCLGDKYAKFF